MTLFKPCIDLHHGKVKQIVGGSLRDVTDGGVNGDGAGSTAKENFVSELPASHYAELYRRDALTGGHVIQLGAGNEAAAIAALAAWPRGLQLGGGVTPKNARQWLDHGASKVIVTSALFDGGALSQARLDEFAKVVSRDELVIDLSCRKRGSGYWVATNRWQTVTETPVDGETLRLLSNYCAEFLVHAADVEGLCQGIEEDVVRLLGAESPIPCTYAGGARRLEDLELVATLSAGRVDLTFGSALDLFGGSGVRYADCVAFNRRNGS
jgi:phosphoribosylformimino-5-aminoimidazole carboxamide ribotide isomerase